MPMVLLLREYLEKYALRCTAGYVWKALGKKFNNRTYYKMMQKSTGNDDSEEWINLIHHGGLCSTMLYLYHGCIHETWNTATSVPIDRLTSNFKEQLTDCVTENEDFYQPHGWLNAYYQKSYIEGSATHHMSNRDSQCFVCHLTSGESHLCLSEGRVFSSLFSSKTCTTCCSFLKATSVLLTCYILPKILIFRSAVSSGTVSYESVALSSRKSLYNMQDD